MQCFGYSVGEQTLRNPGHKLTLIGSRNGPSWEPDVYSMTWQRAAVRI